MRGKLTRRAMLGAALTPLALPLAAENAPVKTMTPFMGSWDDLPWAEGAGSWSNRPSQCIQLNRATLEAAIVAFRVTPHLQRLQPMIVSKRIFRAVRRMKLREAMR